MSAARGSEAIWMVTVELSILVNWWLFDGVHLPKGINKISRSHCSEVSRSPSSDLQVTRGRLCECKGVLIVR